MRLRETSVDIPVIVSHNSGQINITFPDYMINENRAELKIGQRNFEKGDL